MAGIIAGAIISVSIFGFSASVIKNAEYNNTTISLNGQKIPLTQPFVSIIDEQTPDFFSNYMPLREILEKLGYKVDWDNDTHNVNITNISLPIEEIKTNVQLKTYEDDNVKIEYYEVSGIADTAIQKKLNEGVHSFFTKSLAGYEKLKAEKEIVPTLELTAEYAIVGNYLSVSSVGTEYSTEWAYPHNSFVSAVFDMTTGEKDSVLTDYISLSDNLKEAIKNRKFKQIVPDEAPMSFMDTFYNSVIGGNIRSDLNPGFYLTNDSIGIYIDGTEHVTGDYWIFEAKYKDISDLLSDKLSFVK